MTFSLENTRRYFLSKLSGWRPPERIHCHYPFSSIFVSLDGSVAPCCFGTPIGNLKEQSITEMWNGTQARTFRRELGKGDMKAAGCSTCGFRGRRDIETYPRAADLGQAAPIANNIRLQEAEYRDGKEVLDSFPTLAVIQITEACNLECVMCFQKHRPIYLDEAALDRILPDLHRFDEIQFTGGEPFVSVWVQDFLTRFDTSSRTKLSFTTNATLLHRFKDDIERLPRVHFGISIDGATKHTYEKIRVGGDWVQVKENIEWFAGIRRKRKPHWETSRLAFVIMRSNYEEIPLMAEWAAKIEMPILFCPVWGTFAPGENIYDNVELREGLTEPDKILSQVREIVAPMPHHERAEILMSLEHSLGALKPPG